MAKPLILLAASSSSDMQFIYTDMGEAFVTYMKVSFWFSLYTCLPIFFFHVWAFLLPGLYKDESRLLCVFLVISFSLATLGLLVAYFILLPFAWQFFFSFQLHDTVSLFHIQLQPKMNEYFLFVLRIFFFLSLSFQFPLLFILLAYLNLLSSDWMLQQRNYACLFSLIIAAFLSPPDVGSQILLFFPLFFLYEISLFILKLLEEYNKQENKRNLFI